ncbi:MAG: deoxyribodipyrimidine photo-lyase [Flavobacteriales bacterium]|nr:deoxyribodipyrimidine photo-lyase [Flavobacteriales bacterium]
MYNVNVFWFRRDLRLHDNTALNEALNSDFPVLPIFIFDTNIINELDKNDSRISFIHNELAKINNQLKEFNSSLKIFKGEPIKIWSEILIKFNVKKVFYNRDYEPYAFKREKILLPFFRQKNVTAIDFKDHVIFEKNEIVKDDGSPYIVFTPFKRKWIEKRKTLIIQTKSLITNNFHKSNFDFPSLFDLGFIKSTINVPSFKLSFVSKYEETRNFPSLDKTSKIGPHLRFGTVSIREIVKQVETLSEVYLSELIWREFFMQIIHHFPHVITQNFRKKYDTIQWRNNENEFKKWSLGKTGFPIVDAGMRELNKTGFMHNRVRMITASFLCKHLLIDWRWGEAYFATKLLDYELASNNGNWQWCAGTGCDAAPYFRIFNPYEQTKKFDSKLTYINRWIPELNSFNYPKPIVDHTFARKRALETYKAGLTA